MNRVDVLCGLNVVCTYTAPSMYTNILYYIRTYLCVLYTVCSYHQMLETKVKPLKNKLDSMNQFMEDLKKKLVSWNDKMLVRTQVLNVHMSMHLQLI